MVANLGSVLQYDEKEAHMMAAFIRVLQNHQICRMMMAKQ
jgi:hypothetical protein